MVGEIRKAVMAGVKREISYIWPG